MGQSYGMIVNLPAHLRGMMSDESHRQVSSSGVTEHQSLKAMPGISEIELVQADEGTYHVIIYRGFGHPNQEIVKKQTFYNHLRVVFPLGKLDFQWDDIDVGELVK
jgi:hypothetical protein